MKYQTFTYSSPLCSRQHVCGDLNVFLKLTLEKSCLSMINFKIDEVFKFLITVDFVLNPLFLSLKCFNLIGDLVCLIISCLFLRLFQSSLIKNRNFIQFRQKVILRPTQSAYLFFCSVRLLSTIIGLAPLLCCFSQLPLLRLLSSEGKY